MESPDEQRARHDCGSCSRPDLSLLVLEPNSKSGWCSHLSRDEAYLCFRSWLRGDQQFAPNSQSRGFVVKLREPVEGIVTYEVQSDIHAAVELLAEHFNTSL